MVLNLLKYIYIYIYKQNKRSTILSNNMCAFNKNKI